MKKSESITQYISDGFNLVCSVETNKQWTYSKIREEILFDSHRGWIYIICIGKLIVKIGETGLVLGVKGVRSGDVLSVDSRLGRYKGGDGTDAYIRKKLKGKKNVCLCEEVFSS